MAIGVWDPTKKAAPPAVDRPLVLDLLQSFRAGAADDLAAALGADLCGRGATLMKQPEAAWETLGDLPDGDLTDLIRFFTLAEEQLEGWEAGKRSPVIPLVKILRRRDRFEAELRRWIKQHSRNRYLPYGSA